MNTNATSNEPHAPFRRFQFSLWHVFVLMLAICVFLALVTQFWHIGFVAFCFLAGIIGGWWKRRWTLAAASATGMLVFAVTYLACWAELGFVQVMYDEPLHFSQHLLERIENALHDYEKAHQMFPSSLGELEDVDGLGSPDDLLDRWGHHFYYKKTDDTFELASLGKDGKLGGTGLNADVFLGDKRNIPPMRLTAGQFLYETPGSEIVFVVALFASLAASGIWFVTKQRGQFPARSQIVGATVTTFFAIVVATFLASVYISALLDNHH